MTQADPALPFEDDPFERPPRENVAGGETPEAAAPPATPAAPAAPAAAGARPDWLVGAEEGVHDELKRAAAEGKDAGPGPLKIVKLEKPKATDGPAAPAPGSLAPRIGDAPKLSRPAGESNSNPGAPAANHAPASESRGAWTAAASSIPVLRRAPQLAPARPPAAEEYERADDRAPMGELPDDLTGSAPVDQPLVPLREAWWVIMVDELRSNRRTQVMAAAGLLLGAVFLLWPRSDAAVSLSTLHRHPDLYDGRTVVVHGRVLDVFPMGGGHTFFLRQGRDTIVVFTRQSPPSLNQNLSVKGVVSTGYLDGIARQSIFEDQH